MKFLSPKIHGFLDFAVILLLFVAPPLLGFPDVAASISFILGAAYLALVLLTAYPLGLAKLIPFTVHGTIELVLSPLLVALPWLAGFSEYNNAQYFYVIGGIVLFFVWLTTDYKAADIAYRKSGPDLKAGRPRPA